MTYMMDTTHDAEVGERESRQPQRPQQRRGSAGLQALPAGANPSVAAIVTEAMVHITRMV